MTDRTGLDADMVSDLISIDSIAHLKKYKSRMGDAYHPVDRPIRIYNSYLQLSRWICVIPDSAYDYNSMAIAYIERDTFETLPWLTFSLDVITVGE